MTFPIPALPESFLARAVMYAAENYPTEPRRYADMTDDEYTDRCAFWAEYGLNRDMTPEQMFDASEYWGHSANFDSQFHTPGGLLFRVQYASGGASALIEVTPDGDCNLWAD